VPLRNSRRLRPHANPVANINYIAAGEGWLDLRAVTDLFDCIETSCSRNYCNRALGGKTLAFKHFQHSPIAPNGRSHEGTGGLFI
jgi:hypothetical protein